MLRFFFDEEGSVETGLVMIPVMVLFLSVLQLPISSLARIAYSAKLQSDTYLESFIGTQQSSSRNDNYGNIQSWPNYANEKSERQPLPGGGQLFIKTRHISVPPITPLLIGGDQFSSVGISVDENK